MNELLHAVYELCGISAVPSAEPLQGSRFSCLSDLQERPLTEVKNYNDEVRNIVPDLKMNTDLGIPDIVKDRPVILWKTGQLVHVLDITETTATVIPVFSEEGGRTHVSPHAWTLMTEDIQRLALRTSLRTLDVFMRNVVSGDYDRYFKELGDGDKKELAASLVLRVAPHKLALFGEAGKRILKRLNTMKDDEVVLTGMAAAGDLRVLLMDTDPQNAVYAMVRARRLFLPMGKADHSILQYLERRGGELDDRALALAKLENLLTLAQQISNQRNRNAQLKALAAEPPEMQRLHKAASMQAPPPSKMTLHDMQMELTMHGVARAHDISLPEAQTLLTLRRSPEAEERKRFDDIRREREATAALMIQEEVKRLQAQPQDYQDFMTIAAGAQHEDLKSVAEATVDPLRYQASTKRRKLQEERAKQTGRTTFELRREEYQKAHARDMV